MVESLVGPAIICMFILLVTVVGLVAYRIRKKALNPPPTIDDLIARQQAELDEVNKQISEV